MKNYIMVIILGISLIMLTGIALAQNETYDAGLFNRL